MINNKKRLEIQIFSTAEALGCAYNQRNKQLYRQCLLALEIDLVEYYSETKEIHPIDNKLIYLYSKLWEI